MEQYIGIKCTKCGKHNFCGCKACYKPNRLNWKWSKCESYEICGNCETPLPQEIELKQI